MKNRKKLVALIMVLALALTTLVGGTLAYFTDDDEATNVFTMGNVEIDLKENFDQNANLQPGLKVKKEVYVKNTGSNDAYVRVHIAVPAELDSFFNTDRNFLHVEFKDASVENPHWSWRSANTTGKGYVEGDLNSYKTNITFVEDDPATTDVDETVKKPYNVYVVTYRSALASGESTGRGTLEAQNVIEKVYLDTAVNATAKKGEDENGNEVVDSYTYFDDKGNEVTLTAAEAANIQILIVAEGAQTATFGNDAYAALNTTFGVPSAAANPWNNYGKPNP